MQFALVVVIVYFAAFGGAKPEDYEDGVVLSSDQANNFAHQAKRLFNLLNPLEEECYGENRVCETEEIDEHGYKGEQLDEIHMKSQCKFKNKNCKKVCITVKCHSEGWSEWSVLNVAAAGSCSVQRRSMSVRKQRTTVIRLDNCNGVLEDCLIKEDRRTLCKCNTVYCTIGNWGPWSPVPNGKCSEQTRTKPIKKINKLVYRLNSCDGLHSGSCGKELSENRKMCSCPYREDCTLKEWGPWKEVIGDSECRVQTRSRAYNKSINYIERSSCSGLNPCPVIKDETKSECGKSVDENEGPRATAQPPPKPQLEYLGCFLDKPDPKRKRKRPLPKLYYNHRPNIDWHNLDKMVNSCAKKAMAMENRYAVFSIQFWGECWGGQGAKKTYMRDDLSQDCYNIKGTDLHVGMGGTNAVYRIKNMPECPHDLAFKTKISSGKLTNGTWCAKQSKYEQWIELEIQSLKRVYAVGMQGGENNGKVVQYWVKYSKDHNSWVTYHKAESKKEIFAGNTDKETLEARHLDFPFDARFVRLMIEPWEDNNEKCIQVKLFGCDI